MPEDCKQIVAYLSEYLNLELPEEACAEIQQHLSGCAKCVRLAESLRQTVSLCRTYQPGALPDELSRQARAQLEEAWRKAIAARKSPDA